MKYRAEIDGLRALAVVPVILFHAGFDFFSGGFVGVDVFFVISGYLITTILIEDIENKRFSITNFYERRARRILPAMVFVMTICLPFAWILLSDVALSKFGNGLIGVSLFLSNLVFWRQQGYFDESAELNPILHTWSLAVEEQYYVLFPIFLILTWRLGKNRVFWMIVVMAAISLMLSEWGWRNNSIANFYLAPTRAWELFAGSIAAFIVQKKGIQKNNFLALLGLLAIIFSILFYDKNTPFPSLFALVPVVGVVLLVLYAEQETLAAKILSSRAFVSIGLISFSAYLWHQPVFAFFRIYTNQISLDWFIALVLIIVTFMLSYMSWRLVEKPFRTHNFSNKFSLFTLSITSLILIFAFGFASKQASIGAEYKLAKQLSQNNFVYFQNLNERRFMEGRLFYSLEPINTIVVGSSRVMQINSKTIGENIQSFTVSGASIEDDIAFGLEAFAKLNYQNIYISADPWLINLYNRQDRYKSVNKLYKYWLHHMELNLLPTRLLVSRLLESEGSMIGKSLTSLRSSLILNDENMIPNNAEVEAYAKKAYDGSHIYDESYVNQSDDVQLGFASLLDYSMDEFQYDDKAIEKMKKFVLFLKEKGVNVTLILPPYHPKLYEMMENQKPIFLEIEDWYREFAKNTGVRILGSYDGNIVGCSENEFYDGMHPKFSCMQKLFIKVNK